jgi:hypothetical protein
MLKNSFLKLLKNNSILIIASLSFLTALIYNETNLKHLPIESKRNGETVITSDDSSYLRPAKNYLENNKWQEDYWGGKIGSFIRPPGYGLLYLVFIKLLDHQLALNFLKLFQTLLFSVSVYWFYYIAVSILKNKKIALISSVVYGLSPFAIGFLFYTLTEAITPALLLCFVFLLFKAHEKEDKKLKNLFYALASLVFAYLFIVRPVLGIFGLLLLVFLTIDYYKNLRTLSYKLVIFGFISLSFMMTWQIRNYNIAGKYVGLHPIYFEDGNTMYREPFKEYWNFAGGWAEKGDVGFSYMIPLWEAAIKGDTSIVYINNAINHFPNEVTNYFGKQRLTTVLRKYQAAILYQKTFYDKQLPMPLESPAIEKEVVKEFQQLTAEYKSKFWFQYYVLSPLKVFKLMAFHSNLSLYIFQKTYKGALVMEAIRVLFYLIHSLCFLSLIINLFIIRNNRLIWFVLGAVPFIYIFYLCFFQRGIEERYTLPILPFVLIGLMYALNYCYRFFLKISAKN